MAEDGVRRGEAGLNMPASDVRHVPLIRRCSALANAPRKDLLPLWEKEGPFPELLNEQFASFALSLEDADTAPTAQHRETSSAIASLP